MFNNRNSRTNDTRNWRPPPYNPAYNPYRGTNNNNNYNYNNRINPIRIFIKQKLLPFLTLVSLLTIWYLTPISDIIASIVLTTVPIDTDVQLGLQSWETMKQTQPLKYKPSVNYDYWSVESIGYDLVDSVILNTHNVDQLCDSIASGITGAVGTTTGTNSAGNTLSAITSTLHSFLHTKQQCKQQAKQYKWSFQVIKSNDINAFALPGGIIKVTESLLQTLQLSQGEIAALLGHEMSHVLYRHTQLQLLKRDLLSTILKAIFYDDHDEHEESFGEAVHEIMIQSASYLGSLKFSRSNEYQADDGAWEILNVSQRYNPKCVQHLLEKLYSLEGGRGSTDTTAWDKTHPGTGDRIQMMKDKWNALSWNERRRFQSLLA
jgi:Zn-dependent protease with chaperone function